MPLWNEVLVIPVSNLPCLATLKLCVSLSSRMVEHRAASDCATFDFYVTEELCAGFGEERLVSSYIRRCCESCLPEGQDIKLRISCSLDPTPITKRQQGLWPLDQCGPLLVPAARC